MPTAPISSDKKTTIAGRIVVGLFFSVFLAMGLAFSYGFFGKPLARIIAARGWQSTTCEILSSGLHVNSSSDGSTYRVDVTYRYTAAGRTHSGNRYKFMTGSSSGRSGKAAIVAALQPGTRTECWFDPDSPSESVINRSPTPDLLFGLIPLLFVLVGGGGLYFVLFGRWNAGMRQMLGGKTGVATFTPAMSSRAPAMLKPVQTRAAKFVGLTFFALFWNGIVSLFLYQVVESWRRGSVSWFMALFLLPFVGVGVLVIVMAIRQAMELANPRATIMVSAPAAAPGDEITVEWKIAGRLSKLTRFTITLEGREEATYRQGTDTHTDRQVFAALPVATRTQFDLDSAGFAKVLIPLETMHSFDAVHNKIVWVLRVRGEVPNWPDSDDEFAFTVSPRR